MTYRLLDVHTEWPLILDEFTSRGFPPPNPAFAMIVGAFDDENKLHGFLTVQMQLHFEPMVLYSPAAMRGLARAAEQEVSRRFQPGTQYFSFAGNETIGKLLEHMGAVRVPMTLYTKSVD